MLLLPLSSLHPFSQPPKQKGLRLPADAEQAILEGELAALTPSSSLWEWDHTVSASSCSSSSSSEDQPCLQEAGLLSGLDVGQGRTSMVHMIGDCPPGSSV